jgi:hypothetical protein
VLYLVLVWHVEQPFIGCMHAAHGFSVTLCSTFCVCRRCSIERRSTRARHAHSL